jgi:hypothetical protein
MDSDAEVLERSDRFVRKVVAFTEEDSSRDCCCLIILNPQVPFALVAQQDAAENRALCLLVDRKQSVRIYP